MKSLFKKEAVKDRLAVVKEIHEKILTSGEACVNEANEILKNTSVKNIELYQKMASIGFGNVEEITKNKAEIESKRLAYERSKMIQDYMVRYPNHKFITTEAMNKVCEEYKLILGADQHFIGSMPERAMRGILDFKLKEEDEIYYEGTWRAIEAMKFDKTKGVIDWAEIDKESWNRKTKNGTELMTSNKRNHYISNKNYFVVAAPKEMFKTEGLVQEGHELKQIIEVDDPAALKPVKYGYIIAYVWGEEIAIKAMQNEKMN